MFIYLHKVKDVLGYLLGYFYFFMLKIYVFGNFYQLFCLSLTFYRFWLDFHMLLEMLKKYVIKSVLMVIDLKQQCFG